MFELKKKEALFRVRRYDLYRDDGFFSIYVQEIVAGESPYKFHATPSLRGNVCDLEEYRGVGDSESEALKDCLRRIKDISIQALFPPPAS